MYTFYKFLIVSLTCSLFLNENIFAQTTVAPVKTKKGWGYMKSDQIWLIEPFYDRFWQDGMYVVAEDKGESVLCEFHEGMASFRRGERWGFFDLNGQIAVKSYYTEVRDFNDSVAAVKKNGKWGFIDKNGNYIIEPKYEKVRSFVGGLAAVMIRGKWGFINKKDVLVIPAIYSEIQKQYRVSDRC